MPRWPSRWTRRSPPPRRPSRRRQATRSRTATRPRNSTRLPELKYAEAIRTALDTELAADDRVVVIGEEVGALGGVFTVTQGLQERHGEDRVIDSPIAENAL